MSQPSTPVFPVAGSFIPLGPGLPFLRWGALFTSLADVAELGLERVRQAFLPEQRAMQEAQEAWDKVASTRFLSQALGQPLPLPPSF